MGVIVLASRKTYLCSGRREGQLFGHSPVDLVKFAYQPNAFVPAVATPTRSGVDQAAGTRPTGISFGHKLKFALRLP